MPTTKRSMIAIFLLCALDHWGQAASDATPTLALKISGDPDGLQGLPAFSDDGRWFATSSFGHQKGRAKVYSRSGAKFGHPSILEKGARGVHVVGFSADSEALATGNADGTVGVYTTNSSGSWALRHELHEATDIVYSLAHSADQKWFASGSRDKLVRVYGLGNATKPQLRYNLTDAASGEVGFIFSVAFSADSKWLGSGCWDGKLRLYSMNTMGEPRLSYTVQIGKSSQAEPASVNSIAFSANGLWLATGSTDNHLRLFAFNGTGTPILKGDESPGADEPGADDNSVTGVAFSRDSRWLAISSWDKVRVYSLEKGGLNLVYQLDDYPGGGEAEGVTFAEDSNTLAAVWTADGRANDKSGALIYSGFRTLDRVPEHFVV